jgi:hypothetical protein
MTKLEAPRKANAMSLKRWTVLGLTLATFVLSGATCRDSTVLVPTDPLRDKAPTININSFVVGGSGEVEENKENVGTTTTVAVTACTELMISGYASNPVGGVEKFSITIVQDGKTLYQVQGSNTKDASGKAPDFLRILGSDGAGHPGSAVALKFKMSLKPASVTATAVNFNGQTTTITVTYVTKPLPPQITTFETTPKDGYIPVGGSATLKWFVQDCDPDCNGGTVTIQAHDGLNYKTLLSDFPNRPADGSMTVSPTRDTFTRYTLTARNAFGAVTAMKVIQLYLAPPPASGNVYYFKMTNPTSTVTPCFTMAIYAPDETTGALWAEQLNGGYHPETISYAEYVAGCH